MPLGAPADAPFDDNDPVTEQVLYNLIRADPNVGNEKWARSEDSGGLSTVEKNVFLATSLVFDDEEFTPVTAGDFKSDHPADGKLFNPPEPDAPGAPHTLYLKKLSGGKMTIRFHINVGAYTSYLVERRKNVKFRLRVRSTNPHLPNLDVVSRPFVTKSPLGRNISSADRRPAARQRGGGRRGGQRAARAGTDASLRTRPSGRARAQRAARSRRREARGRAGQREGQTLLRRETYTRAHTRVREGGKCGRGRWCENLALVARRGARPRRRLRPRRAGRRAPPGGRTRSAARGATTARSSSAGCRSARRS